MTTKKLDYQDLVHAVLDKDLQKLLEEKVKFSFDGDVSIDSLRSLLFLQICRNTRK